MKTIKHFLPALLAACLLCSCAKAPEKPEGSELLSPTADVIKNARAEIEGIRAADGIFKLDDARIILPENAELPVYTARSMVTSFAEDAAQAEKTAAALGFDMKDLRFSLVNERRDILSKEEYTAQSECFAICEPSDGSRELVYHISCTDNMSREYSVEHYGKIDFDRGAGIMSASEIIALTDADSETLSREIELVHGKTTIGGLVSVIEKKREGLPYDEKMTFKPVLLMLFERENGKFAAAADVRAFVDGACFSDSSASYSFNEAAFGFDEPFPIAFRNAAVFIRPDFADYQRYMGTNIAFERRGDEKYDGIISAKKLFELLRDKFSGGTVYDVRELSLGYLTLVPQEDRQAYFDRSGAAVIPVWQARLNTANMTYSVTVHAVTGEINVRAANANELFP